MLSQGASTLGKGVESAEARARSVPRNLRRDVEDIFDQVVIGDASFQGIKLLTTRSTQLIHRLQSPQDIHVCHALFFDIITRSYVSPSKNGDDMISFLRILIPRVGYAPSERELTVFVESEN